MILNASGTHLVSSLGWVDRGAVWLCVTGSAQIRRVPLSEAKHLSLHPGRGDFFAAVHHFDGPRLAISAHRIDSPDEAVSRILFDGTAPTFVGDPSVWDELPHAYVAFYARDYNLLLITSHPPNTESQRFDWYDDSYDHFYQGIEGVTEVPGTDLLIVSVMRDSSPVLYDTATRKAVRKISLSGQRSGGSPRLHFRRTAPELWAVDYDTLLRLNPQDWSVIDAIRLQDASDPNSRLFVGNFSFNRNETLCVVARPYSGDVIALDTSTFKVSHRAAVGRQPMDVALLSDGRVFARDWKTGDLLQGELEEH